MGAPGVVAEPGRFEPGAGFEPSGMVGGVDGMLVPLSDGMVDEVGGFTAAPVEVEVSVEAAGMVAEVSADMPVEAVPLHQSLLARVLGEAFR